MTEIKLVALSAEPFARPSLRIADSRGIDRWTHIAICDEGAVIEGADRVMRATLEAEMKGPSGVSPGCEFIQLGTPTAATEEAFNRTMRHSDMARAMGLPGALSARRYVLEGVVGRCDWESITFYGFEGNDVAKLTEALVDVADVWEGDPSCIVMRVEPAHQGAEQA